MTKVSIKESVILKSSYQKIVNSTHLGFYSNIDSYVLYYYYILSYIHVEHILITQCTSIVHFLKFYSLMKAKTQSNSLLTPSLLKNNKLRQPG